VSDDDDAAELLDEVDVRSMTVIWNEEDDRPEVAFSGCSVYEAIGLAVTAVFRLLGAEQWPFSDDDDEETDD
jgi:hypothetical protein